MTNNLSSIKDNYLETPEAFRKMVEDQVHKELEKTDIISTKRSIWKSKSLQVAAVACVCLILLGGTAYAATRYFTTKFLEYPVSDSQATKNIDTDSEKMNAEFLPGRPEVMEEIYGNVNKVFKEPTLDIQEVYYDGLTLSIYAQPTKVGKKYDLFNSNRMVIEDTIYMSQWEEDKDGYTARVDLADFNLPDSFSVEMPIEVTKKIGKSTAYQYVTFSASIDTDIITKSSDKIAISDGLNAQINSMKITDTAAYIDVTWEFSNDYKAKFYYDNEARNQCIGMIIDDNQGKTYDSLSEGSFTQSIAIHSDGTEEWKDRHNEFYEENGNYYFRTQCIIYDLTYDVSDLSITPYLIGDGDTSSMEFAKFTATFKN